DGTTRWRMGLRPWLSLMMAGIVPHPGDGLHRAARWWRPGVVGDDGVTRAMVTLVRPSTAGARGTLRVQCRAHGARQAGRCALPHGRLHGEKTSNGTAHATPRHDSGPPLGCRCRVCHAGGTATGRLHAFTRRAHDPRAAGRGHRGGPSAFAA